MSDQPMTLPEFEEMVQRAIEDAIQRNMTPLCWVCGQPMEWTGEYREIEFDAGCWIVEEPIYECRNEDCWDEDEDGES